MVAEVATRERPIIFSGAMVKAILSGSKTQTRCVLEVQPSPDSGLKLGHDDNGWYMYSDQEYGPELKCPYGKIGDRLWMTMKAPSWKGQNVEERFWSRVIKTDECWEWMGTTDRKKYGQIKFGQKTLTTHRFSYILANGEPPVDKHIMHTCDKPWCVNPAHLIIGNNADNCADKSRKGRTPRKYGECSASSKVSDSDAKEISRRYLGGEDQAKLAECFGISQPNVSRIVNGLRRSKTGIYLPPRPVGLRTLEVTDVRIEKVQSISEEDARAEGCDVGCRKIGCDCARQKFVELWSLINGKRNGGKYSWYANPMIWAVTFKRIDGGR